MSENIRSQGSVLLVRMDRIGDLVLSLPCDTIFQRAGFLVQWAILRRNAFILRNSSPSREYVTLEGTSARESFIEFFHLLWIMRPKMIVIYHGPWWVSMIAWMIGIPTRVGVRSQWHSFLFLTHSLRQRRSNAKKHEMEYNMSLSRFAVETQIDNRVQLFRTVYNKGTRPLQMIAPSKDKTLLDFNLEDQHYYVIHPGMAGSARNWPTRRYIKLIEVLVARGLKVVITGTDSDRGYLDEIEATFQSDVMKKKIVWLVGDLKSHQLLDILSGARAVVVPSTGVAHLAASLGTRVVGLYSPVRVQAPRRWAPRGKEVRVLVPEVKCPGHMRCLMEKCKDFDCMRTISVEDVLAQMGLPLQPEANL